MKVLIDTNIVLDYLGANHGFTETAEKVFNLSEKRKDITFVSASAITDIIYVLKRAVKDMQIVKNKYKGFRSKISILPVTEADIDKVFSRNWKDFEDAVQYTVAETNNVDCIITRNKKDFERSRATVSVRSKQPPQGRRERFRHVSLCTKITPTDFGLSRLKSVDFLFLPIYSQNLIYSK